MLQMNLNEQVEQDFVRARRWALLRRLASRLRGEPASSVLPFFDDARRALRAYNRVGRGTRVVELEKIVGSVGRHRDFDHAFMPLRAGVGERWKRVDLAFHRAEELPPVSLYKIGDAYFVQDGNHRVSVARYHGVTTIEAVVTEFRPTTIREPEHSPGRASGRVSDLARGAVAA